MLKDVLKKSKLTAPLYKKLANMKMRVLMHSKRKNLQKRGAKTIALIQKMLKECSCRFFVDMGTLLGIIREGKLLGHDLDIDIGCFVKNEDEKQRIFDTLIQNGCKLKYRYTVDGLGIVEESYVFNKIKFDINYYTNDNETESTCYLLYDDPQKYSPEFMSVVRLTCDTIEEIICYKWNDILVNVPANPEKYLAQRYGSNWRIPDKNYIYWKGPSTTPTDLKGYRMIL